MWVCACAADVTDKMAKKRKNKALPLFVLIGVFCALLVGYNALSSANDRREAEEAAQLEAENATILIAQYDYTTTAKLSYQRRGEDKLTFLVNGGAWTYADDANFPLDQTIVSGMAYAISTIGIETEVTEGSAADYGLDDPAYTIEISYADGTNHTYKVGDYNSFNGAYYFSMDGYMFMVAPGLLDYFNYGLTDLLALDTVPTTDWAELGYVLEATVTDGESSAVISDEAGKEGVISALSGISLTECADWYADEAEKAAYGLDSGASAMVKYKKAVTTTDENGNSSTSYLETGYTLTIGALTENGYYVSPAKSSIVYTVSEDAVNAVLAYAAYVPEA